MASKVVEEHILRLGIDDAAFKKGLQNTVKGMQSMQKSFDGLKTTNIDGIGKSVQDAGEKISSFVSKIPLVGKMVDAITNVGKASTNTANALGGINGNGFASVADGAADASTAIHGISGATSAVQGGFSLLEGVAVVALGNIAAKALQTGTSMIKSLTLDPIMGGFRDYETEIQSVRKLASAMEVEYGSEGYQQIKDRMKDLEEYAQLTKYSEQQMYTSLSSFVNKGLDIDQSALAIKGFSNLAADSGIDKGEYERALTYGLQQSLSMGYMGYIDWKSMEPMASMKLKNNLFDTAKQLGTVTDADLESYGGINGLFKDGLKDGWLTNDVWMTTLQEAANDESLLKMATQAYSFSDAMGMVSEQVTSKWGKMWQAIIGDYEDASKIWTPMAEALGAALTAIPSYFLKIAEAFNKLEGRKVLFEAFGNAWKSLEIIMEGVGRAFNNVFPKSAENTAKGLIGVLQTLSEKFKLNEAVGKAVESIFTLLFTVLKMGIGVVGSFIKVIEFLIPDNLISNGLLLIGIITDIVNGLIGLGGSVLKSLDLSFLDKIFDFFSKGSAGLMDWFTESLIDISKNLKSFIDGFKDVDDLFKSIKMPKWMNDIQKFFSELVPGNPFAGIMASAEEIGSNSSKLTAKQGGLSLLIGGISESFDKLVSSIKEGGNFFESVIQFFGRMIDSIKEFIGLNASSVTDFFKNLSVNLEPIGDMFRKLGGVLADFTMATWSAVKSFFEWLASFDWSSPIKAIGGIIEWTAEKFEWLGKLLKMFSGPLQEIAKFIGGMFADFTNGLEEGSATKAAVILLLLDKIMNIGDKIDNFKEKFGGFLDNFNVFKKWSKVKDILTEIAGFMHAKKFEAYSRSLKNVAIAIAIFAGSMMLLSLIPGDKISQTILLLASAALILSGAFLAVATGIAMIRSANSKTGNMVDDITDAIGFPELKKVLSAIARATMLISLGVTLVLVAKTFQLLSKLNNDQLISGAIVLVGSIATLVAAVNLLPDIKGNSHKVIDSLVKSIAALSLMVWVLGKMDSAQLKQGGLTLLALLSMITIATGIISFIESTGNITDGLTSNKLVNSIKSTILALAGVVVILGILPNSLIQDGLLALTGISAIVVAMFSVLALLTKFTTVGDIVQINKSLLNFGIVILALSSALGGLAIISRIAGANNILAAGAAVTMVLGVLTGLSLLLTNFTGSKDLNGAVKSIMLMSASIMVIAGSMAMLVLLNPDQLMQAGIAISTIMLVLTIAMTAISGKKFDKDAAINILAFVGSLILIVGEIRLLASMELPKLIQGMVSLGLLMAAMVGVLLVMDKVNGTDGAISMAMIAVTIYTIAHAIEQIASLNLDKIAASTIALVGLLLTVTGMMFVLDKVSGVKGAIGVLAIIGVIATLTIALTTLSELPANKIISALIGIGGALAIVLAAGAIAAFVSPGLVVLAAALVAVGAAALMIGAGSLMAGLGFEKFAEALKGFSESMIKNLDLILEWLAKSPMKIAEGMAGLIGGFALGVAKSAGEITNAVGVLIVSVLTSINEHAPKIVETVLSIVANLSTKMLSMIPSHFIRMGSEVIKGMQMLAMSISNNKTHIVNAFVGIFVALGEVLIEFFAGLLDVIGLGFLGDKLRDFGASAADKFAEAFPPGMSAATKKGAESAIAEISKMEPAMKEQAMQFANSAADGVGKITTYLSMLGVQGANEFVTGIQNGTIPASEAGRLLAQMAEAGASEGDLQMIAEALGGSYADGIFIKAPDAAIAGKALSDSSTSMLDGSKSAFAQKGAEAAAGLPEGMMTQLSSVGLSGNTLLQQALGSMTDKNLQSQYLSELMSGNYSEGLKSFLAQAGINADSLKNNAIDGFKDKSNASNTEGSNQSGSYAKGISDNASTATTAASTVASSSADGFDDQTAKTKAANAGTAIVNSMAGAIQTAGIGILAPTIASTLQTAKNYLPNSPAKTGPFSGRGWVQVTKVGGAIIGAIADGIRAAAPRVESTMGSVLSAVQDSLNSVSDYSIEELSISPRITPVVDMTDVMTARGYLDNLSFQGSTELSTSYGRVNANTARLESQEHTVDTVVRGMDILNKKFSRLIDINEAQAHLIAEERDRPVLLDGHSLTDRLAPNMAKAQQAHTDRLNRLGGTPKLI